VSLQLSSAFALGDAPDSCLSIPSTADKGIAIGRGVERADVVGMANKQAFGVCLGTLEGRTDVDDGVFSGRGQEAFGVCRRGSDVSQRVDERGGLYSDRVIVGGRVGRSEEPLSDGAITRGREDTASRRRYDSADLRGMIVSA
jgi:hypothetical protein